MLCSLMGDAMNEHVAIAPSLIGYRGGPPRDPLAPPSPLPSRYGSVAATLSHAVCFRVAEGWRG
jgi:hypothetical protein